MVEVESILLGTTNAEDVNFGIETDLSATPEQRTL